MAFRIRHFKWRDGRPRWEPSPGLRDAGWPGVDLKSSYGAWLPLGEAIEAAEAINGEVDAWRGTKAKTPPRMAPPRKHPRSCQALVDLYRGIDGENASPKWRRLRASTQNDYGNKLDLFLASAIDIGGDGQTLTFANISVLAIEPHHLYSWWEEQVEARGHHMANGMIAVIRTLFSYGRLKGWRRDNPARGLQIEVPDERLAIWLPEQARVFLEVADELRDKQGRSLKSVGDAFLVALHSGQRLADVLAMPDSIFADERIALTQMKRGALIDTKMTPQMAARVAEIRARRREKDVPSIGGALIVNEMDGLPYTKRAFNTRFRLVRAAAAKRLATVQRDPRWQGPRVYEIGELRMQDTRDTYVTRSALAGNDAAHIAAVTGHSLETITTVMKHYLALTRAMADTATDRVVEWLRREGIQV